MRKSTRRIVLWKKQRQFLDACLKGQKTVGQAMSEFKIAEKTLASWFTKPAFRRQFFKVKNFLEQCRDLDLTIGAKHGANLLTEQQLKKSGEAPVRAELLKLASGRQATQRDARDKKPKLKRLSHPGHSPEERERLLRILGNKKRPA